MYADPKTWPQLLPFRHPISAEHPSRFFVVAVFVSMVIHAFLVYLLCVVFADRTTVVEPAPPSIGTPLIVSLVSLPPPTTASHDGMDGDVVPAEPHTDPVDQNFQSPSEGSRSTGHRSEADSSLTSKDQGVPDLEAPPGESPATDADQSTDVAASGHIGRVVVRIPEFEAGLVLKSKGRVVLGPEAPAGKSFATGSIPSFGLGVVYPWEVERTPMTEFELQDLRSKWLVHYQQIHPDVPRFAGAGLLSTPFFLKDIITGNGYKWFIQVNPEDLERQKDTQARLEYMSNLMNQLIFSY